MNSRSARRLLGFVVALLLGSVWALNSPGHAGAGQEASTKAPVPQEVTLKPVKYQELIDAVKAQKGKVVVVDVWATYCAPCKVEFPHFLELHEKRAKDDVVCISVSIDDKENREVALAYLKKQNATTTNFWLDESSDVWAKKWNVKRGVPIAFVFDKQGKIAKKFDNENEKADPFTYKEVTKVVDELLKADF